MLLSFSDYMFWKHLKQKARIRPEILYEYEPDPKKTGPTFNSAVLGYNHRSSESMATGRMVKFFVFVYVKVKYTFLNQIKSFVIFEVLRQSV